MSCKAGDMACVAELNEQSSWRPRGRQFFGRAGVRLRVVQDELRREPDEFIWLFVGLMWIST